MKRRWEEQEEENAAKKARLEEEEVPAIVLDPQGPIDDDASDAQIETVRPNQEHNEQHSEVQIYKGSVEDVIFIIYDEIKKKEIKNLFVFMQRRVVWVRFSAKITLGALKDHLLVLYPDNFLVNPTFSANNNVFPLGK